MARLNITLPDVLYARLEQLRDRINLSKVCATALEKEVTMLEGQPPITDPRIARLLQRLQSARERWHQRGYEDGIQWAVDLASRDELQSVAIHLAELDGRQLAEFFQMWGEVGLTTQLAPPPSPSPTLHVQPPMSVGQAASGGIRISGRTAPAMPAMLSASQGVFSHHHRVGIPFPGFPTSFHPAERLQYWQDQDRERSAEVPQGEAARIEVDESAYLEGWRDAVKGIWQTISPALS
jgi:ribosome modulation factor